MCREPVRSSVACRAGPPWTDKKHCTFRPPSESQDLMSNLTSQPCIIIRLVTPENYALGERLHRFKERQPTLRKRRGAAEGGS